MGSTKTRRIHLNGKDRLPWENRNLDETLCHWASSLVCAATLRRGLTPSTLRSWKPTGDIQKPKDFRPVYDIVERVISKSTLPEIPPFEPDYLGESFFLTYLASLLNRPEEFELFCEFLSVGTAPEQDKGAVEFVSFMRRLTRNLLDDDQTRKTTQKHWSHLFEFLQPKNFKKETLMHWAASVALFESVSEVKHIADDLHGQTELIEATDIALENIFERIDVKDLLPPIEASSRLINRATQVAIRFHKEKSEKEAMAATDLKQFVDDLRNYDAIIPSEPVLNIALLYQHSELALHLIYAGYDLYSQNQTGVTALMHACHLGQEHAALAMINKMDRLDQQNGEGWTALMVACRYGQEQAALAMIEKMDRLDQQGAEGWTSADACLPP
jgi:FOG: Ankyrin repeat